MSLSTHLKNNKKRDNHSVWISFKGKNSIWKHSGYRMDIWGNFYFQKQGIERKGKSESNIIIRMRKQIYIIQYPSAEREVIVCNCLIKK